MKQINVKIVAMMAMMIFAVSTASAQYASRSWRKQARPVAAQAHHDRRYDSHNINPNVILVTTDRSDKTHHRLLREVQRTGAELVYNYRNMSCVAIRKPAGWSLEKTRNYFANVRGVRSVSYDHVHQTQPVRPRPVGH